MFLLRLNAASENSLEGMVAEIKEELGINVDSKELKLFKTIKTEDDFVDLYYLKKDININDIVIQKEEVEDVKWVTKDEINEMIKKGIFLPPHIEFYNYLLEFKNKKNYYKAYEERYKQVYDKNMLWSSKLPTLEVIKFLKDYNAVKDDRILDLGCGEGRDAIFLLEKGYNVLAVDYSLSVINMCNKLSNNKYKDHFKQFDIIENKMGEKFKYIYSIAVLHMFVLKEHRNKFLSFIREHLTDDGYCLLCILGDGKQNYVTNINDAFKNTKRVVINNNEEIDVVSTSCKIVNWDELEKEIIENKLKIEKKWIANDIPEFVNSMCVIIKLI